MHDVFMYMVAAINLISMLHLGFYIVGANLYDIRRDGDAAKAKKLAAQRRKPYSQPLLSVIVPAYNEEVGIVRTLDSLLASDYPNIEIIVVDDGSKDNTGAVVQAYIKRLQRSSTVSYMARNPRTGHFTRRYMAQEAAATPKITYVRQENRGKGEALNNGIANYAKGKLVMCLDADSQVRSDAITNMVAHFRDNSVVGAAANVRVTGGNSWLSLLQRFEHMIGYRSKKFYSMTGTEFIVGGVASTYRRSTLKQVGLYDTDTLTEDIGLSLKVISRLGNRNKRIIYASDVVAMTGGVLTYRQLIRQRYRWKMGMLQNLFKYRSLLMSPKARKYSLGMTFYRLPMSVLSEFILMASPFVIGYIVYVSIAYHTFTILLGAYFTITLYVLWNVWPDEYLSVKQKLRMSFFSLYMYAIFYTMDLVQLMAVFKCIKNYKTIIQGSRHTNWTPPTRAGQAQQLAM